MCYAGENAMELDIFLTVISAVLLLAGFAGTVVPILPGAPLAWLGLFISYFSSYTKITPVVLVVTAVIAVAVSVADNIFPVLLTKKSGGSKAGTWGSTIGLVLGICAGPAGILVGPFLGALVGELIHDSSDTKRAFTAAFGAFKGFLLGTGIKMAACALFIWIFIISFV